MGTYIRLIDYKNSELKEREFFNEKNRYTSSTKDFSKIPGSPIAYWVSEKVHNNVFTEGITLEEKYAVRQGIATGDNQKFTKIWFEVAQHRIIFNGDSFNEVIKNPLIYVPYNKGGEYRKWYGNMDTVLYLNKNTFPLLSALGNHLPSREYYFKTSLSWTFVSSTNFGVRLYPAGFAFDVAGSSVFPSLKEEFYLLGFMNSKIVTMVMSIYNPTMNFQVGDVKKIVIKSRTISKEVVEKMVEENISISRHDWDSQETSWDFKQNELIRLKSSDGSIKSTLEEYKSYWTSQFFQLHKNEVELNRIFIEIYGIQDELTPDVPLSDITILKDEIAERDEENKTIKFDELVLIKQFISYAVGCMVGRYSLDVEGLVYAGGEFDSSKYQTFKVDKDGIIPILPDDRFDDDITSRFKEFVKVVFGEKNYSSNIEYIASILGRKDDETAIDCIRRYFLNDFYKDHVKMYKKRPIYWLYSSGKEKGFNAIVYMHRYKKETISILRMDYLHKLQRSYDTDYETAEKQEKSISDSKQKIQLQKKMIYLKAILQELKKYDELLRHYADKQVEIDLDDGVVVNYEKFKDLLVKI